MRSSRNLKICVLSGGFSAEADVSRRSGAEVAMALESSFSNVARFELDSNLQQRLAEFQPDVVFPVLHGPPGEDGTLQDFLEMLGLAYVGSGVCASACAMNQHIAKQLFTAAGLPVVRDALLHRESTDVRRAVHWLHEQLFPLGLVVKPKLPPHRWQCSSVRPFATPTANMRWPNAYDSVRCKKRPSIDQQGHAAGASGSLRALITYEYACDSHDMLRATLFCETKSTNPI